MMNTIEKTAMISLAGSTDAGHATHSKGDDQDCRPGQLRDDRDQERGRTAMPDRLAERVPEVHHGTHRRPGSLCDQLREDPTDDTRPERTDPARQRFGADDADQNARAR